MDKTKQTLMIAGIAILAVVVGGWFLLIAPQRASVSTLQTEQATQDKANADIQVKIQQLKAQSVERPADIATLEAIAKRLPPNLQEANLIRSLTHAAAAANVNLQVITPGAPVLVAAPVAATLAPTTTAPASGAPAVAGAAKPAAAPATNQLYTIPLSLTVIGNYFDIEMFIHNLETMQRAVLLNQITLAGGTTAIAGNTAASPTAAANKSGSTSKATKLKDRPAPGTPEGAAAAAAAIPPFVADVNTLTLNVNASTFSMYTQTPIPAATPAPAPTK